MRPRRARLVAVAALIALAGGLLGAVASPPAPAKALSGSDFDAGYIISDYAFFNGSAMSQSQIQSFLNSKIGNCGNDRCLNVLKVKTPNKSAAAPFCEAYTGSGTGTESVASIIYKVQAACDVSAKVILVTLQKEQGLVTHKSPSAGKLERAMGYYCPDDPDRPGWCHPDFAGVFNQIYNAAKQYQRYGTGSLTWYKVGETNRIAYHPNDACGTKSVLIKNRATAALYYYTPYTPDAAALANLGGTGGSCSSYGNRNFWAFYSNWFGSPTISVPDSADGKRIAGDDRYATSVAVSKEAYPNGAATVYVAVGMDYADGLAAAPAAARDGAPLLLTRTGSLPPVIKAEIQRLGPDRIVVVGGTGVVSGGVVSALKKLAPDVERWSGSDRYATARVIADSFTGAAPVPVVYIANGEDFPDALAASAAAGTAGGPVLLVSARDRSVSPALSDVLQRLGATTIVIAGGEAVVSRQLAQALDKLPGTSVTRRAGADRYGTAVSINAYAFPSGSTASATYIASGRDYPDALSAAATAGAQGAPLYLSNGSCTPSEGLQMVDALGVQRVYFVGGTGVLSSSVARYNTCG